MARWVCTRCPPPATPTGDLAGNSGWCKHIHRPAHTLPSAPCSSREQICHLQGDRFVTFQGDAETSPRSSTTRVPPGPAHALGLQQGTSPTTPTGTTHIQSTAWQRGSVRSLANLGPEKPIPRSVLAPPTPTPCPPCTSAPILGGSSASPRREA